MSGFARARRWIASDFDVWLRPLLGWCGHTARVYLLA